MAAQQDIEEQAAGDDEEEAFKRLSEFAGGRIGDACVDQGVARQDPERREQDVGQRDAAIEPARALRRARSRPADGKGKRAKASGGPRVLLSERVRGLGRWEV